MHDEICTHDHPSSSEGKKPFCAPVLNVHGLLFEVTRGPGQGTEDAIIFAPGGDPFDDPS